MMDVPLYLRTGSSETLPSLMIGSIWPSLLSLLSERANVLRSDALLLTG
jgi:hypothetical protein